mgnify:CR=1 FL=1
MQPSEVEDGDPVGDVADDAEVVRDEEVGDLLLRLELDEQVEDRRLHGDVERRGRLVADDELRVSRERARDRDPLLEAAGELHGLLRQRPLGEAHARDEISCIRCSAAAPPQPAELASASAAGSAARSAGG